MAFSKLPTELLDAVCQAARPTDLAALSQTCSSICPVAQRLLYRQIRVSHVSRNLGIILTLAKKPSVARFVRSLSVTLDPNTPVFYSFYRHLAAALSSMAELTSLDLFVDPEASWVLRECKSLRQLSHFASSFPLDSHVACFLSKTPSLTELEVDSSPSPHSFAIPLSHTSIPRLVQFIGSSEAARFVVPGRPVESVHLSSGDLNDSEIACLATSSAPIVVLGATTSSLPVPFLDSLGRHMPYLSYLRVMTTYEFTSAPDVAFYEEVANKLAALPELSAFELSGMHWGSTKKKDSGDKTVWQSAPPVVPFNHGVDFDEYSDVSLAY